MGKCVLLGCDRLLTLLERLRTGFQIVSERTNLPQSGRNVCSDTKIGIEQTDLRPAARIVRSDWSENRCGQTIAG
jgi:hypothetical protein